MDWQTLLVALVVAAAAVRVGRTLWPRRGGAPGCADCAAAPKRDDYV